MSEENENYFSFDALANVISEEIWKTILWSQKHTDNTPITEEVKNTRATYLYGFLEGLEAAKRIRFDSSTYLLCMFATHDVFSLSAGKTYRLFLLEDIKKWMQEDLELMRVCFGGEE